MDKANTFHRIQVEKEEVLSFNKMCTPYNIVHTQE